MSTMRPGVLVIMIYPSSRGSFNRPSSKSHHLRDGSARPLGFRRGRDAGELSSWMSVKEEGGVSHVMNFATL